MVTVLPLLSSTIYSVYPCVEAGRRGPELNGRVMICVVSWPLEIFQLCRKIFFSSQYLITLAYPLSTFSFVSLYSALIASYASSEGCGTWIRVTFMCSTVQSSPQSAGHPFFEQASINAAVLCNISVPLGCNKLYLPNACFISGSRESQSLLANALQLAAFCYSDIIADLFFGSKILLKCCDGMDFSFLVSKLLCFIIFVVNGIISMFSTYSSVAPPYITIGYSMNLHIVCMRAVVLPSVWVHVIQKLLVCYLMGSGPVSLNSFHVAAIFHLHFFCINFFSWDDPICLTWCEWYIYNYVVKLL